MRFSMAVKGEYNDPCFIGARSLVILTPIPVVPADAERLAELREMIAALSQYLKRVETYTLHSALREGNEALRQLQR
jgi:hypothetical protein